MRVRTIVLLRWGWLTSCCVLLLLSLARCSQTEPSTECNFDHQCKEKGARCIYSDPTCGGNVGNLSCKGVCKVVNSENNNNTTCACKKDEDCNYPFEGCGNCQCYKRSVLVCKTEKDCGRGRLCVGKPGKRVCEIRTTCSKDSDCLNNYVCRAQSCCSVSSGRCPGQCKTGSSCQDDLDCLVCGLSCKDGQCAKAGPSCSGVKCTANKDCTQCGGTCLAGFCKVNNLPNCLGKVCTSNAECSPCGSLCRAGKCQKTGTPTCNTGSCISDSDCKSRGLNSCLNACCR